MSRYILALVLCGCGRIDFDLSSGQMARPDDAGTLDAPRLALDAGQCPTGYQHAGTSCYRLVVGTTAGMTDWVSGEKLCEADALGAHLVVIDDAVERDTLMTTIGITRVTWIGTSKRATASYRTVTDMAAYLALGVQTEPSEDCLSIETDGLMYLHSCPDHDQILCEYDGIPAVPSAY